MACVYGSESLCSAAGPVAWMLLAAGVQGVGVEMRLDVRPIPRCRSRANQHMVQSEGAHPVPVCMHHPWSRVVGSRATQRSQVHEALVCTAWKSAPQGITAAASAARHLVAYKRAPGFCNRMPGRICAAPARLFAHCLGVSVHTELGDRMAQGECTPCSMLGADHKHMLAGNSASPLWQEVLRLAPWQGVGAAGCAAS